METDGRRSTPAPSPAFAGVLRRLSVVEGGPGLLDGRPPRPVETQPLVGRPVPPPERCREQSFDRRAPVPSRIGRTGPVEVGGGLLSVDVRAGAPARMVPENRGWMRGRACSRRLRPLPALVPCGIATASADGGGTFRRGHTLTESTPHRRGITNIGEVPYYV